MVASTWTPSPWVGGGLPPPASRATCGQSTGSSAAWVWNKAECTDTTAVTTFCEKGGERNFCPAGWFEYGAYGGGQAVCYANTNATREMPHTGKSPSFKIRGFSSISALLFLRG